jgi:hypothetical protein
MKFIRQAGDCRLEPRSEDRWGNEIPLYNPLPTSVGGSNQFIPQK